MFILQSHLQMVLQMLNQCCNTSCATRHFSMMFILHNQLANSTPNAESVLQHKLRNTSFQHLIHPAQSLPKCIQNAGVL